MKTFTTCAKKKAKQILNLLQGYTKGIRMTAILILLLMGVSNMSAATITSDGTARLYFKMDAISWWVVQANEGANFAYFFNSSSNAWSTKAVQYSGQQYYVVIPKGSWTTVILTRNGSQNSPSWNNKFNQTGNITLSNTSNYISKFSENGTSVTWGAAVKPASTGSLSASSTSINIGANVTLTSSLTSNQTINDIKSTSYNISPNSGASISGNTFTATKAGTYTVTATITYNPDGYTSLTSEVSPTVTITVNPWTITWDPNEGSVTPTSSTYDGATAVSLPTPTRTGYNFDGWYTAASGGTKINDIGTTTKPTNNVTYYAHWTPKTYTITLNANDGESNGSATATYNNNTVTIASHPTRTDYRCNGYYTAASGGTLVLNTDGTLAKNVNGYTDANGNWTKDGNATLYAQWTYDVTEYTVTFGVGTGSTSYGSLSAKNNSTSATTITSPATVRSGQNITFTATPKTGYIVEGWYTNAACTTGKHNAGNTTYTTSITGNTNVYVKFVEKTWSVAFAASTGGAVSPKETQTVGEANGVTIIATPNKGYTFAGWTSSNGGKFDDAKAEKTTFYPNTATTVTASFTENLYAITVKSSDNNHGTVTQSTDKAGIATTIAITATPKDGYRFVNWVATNGITIADAHDPSTTITAANPGTVTAKFDVALATTIYLRPNAAWRQANARFAVYYWKGNSNGWLDMKQVSDNQDYYQATIPAGYTDFKFVRMNPANTANNWGNDCWNQTGDLKLPSGGKNLYDMRLHLKPNSNWLADGARFAARFYVEENGNTIEKWVDLTNADGDGVYECDVPIDRTYPKVIITRMNPNKKENNWDNKWNQTGDLDFDAYYNSNDFQKTANLFTIPSDSWDNADNNNWSTLWKTYTAYTYGVTLYKSNFGQYGFIHNGIRYYSPVVSNDTTYQIPIDATITLFSHPYNAAYNGNIMIAVGDERFEMVPEESDNPTLKVSAPIVLDDNYKTKNPTVVYLGVPNNGGTWVSHAGTNIMYAFHGRTWLNTSEYASVKMTEVGRVTIKVGEEDVEHIYYSCVIPAGYNNIRFESRKNAASFATNDLKTKDMAYRIPLNSLNCYTLGGKENSDNHKFIGGWDIAPAFEGDFRIWHQKTESVGYASDIIRKGVQSQIVSLHIYPINAGSTYPKLTLQKRVNGNWTDVNSKLVKDITKIKSDSQDQGCGVWNFTVTQSNNSATVNFTTPQRYTGNYYIRTNNSEGGWYNYALATNQMTFSSYAKAHSHYTHYFCKWITTASPNVKFIVANDYCAVLSNELAQDSHTAEGGIIVENANVRWSWNEMTNEVSRAYILGTHNTNSVRNSNIVINYNNGSGTVKNDILNDLQDWIYEIDLTDIKSGATLNTLHATYPSKTINGVTADTQTFAEDMSILKSDDADSKYTVRVIYDFKINQTLVMLVPVGTVTTGVDVLIERKDQGDATQVQSTINAANMTEGYTVYATMTFTKAHLESVKSDSEKLYYWVSFPFNVRISDVFGFGEYGKHWIMQYYDGEKRAQEGCWAESSFWTFVTDTTGNEWNNGVLEANRGYVLALAKKINEMGIFSHNNTSVSLYFPSREKITTIGQNIIDTSVELPAYTCTIERDNRKFYDSNWHMIGVPSYSDKQQTIYQDSLLYYYAFDATTNKYTVKSTKGSEVTFKSMHSYLVQFAGTINWRATWQLTAPQGLAARRDTDSETDFRSLRLELQHNGEYADQTFVQMQSEQATAEYDMNIDLTKFMNAGANIYTLTSDENIQLAGNVLPLAQTTIALGVVTTTDGEYTFTMPEGTDGMVVELIDYVENTTTNLLFNDYIVNLPAGTYENRFALHVQPSKVVTNLDNMLDAEHGTKKYIINGQLIIQTSEGIFNAQGTRL